MLRVPGLIRVGHKGADHVAPGNTVESFEAALEHGVDMIEFDVLRTRADRLVLAHDYEDAGSRECLTLDEGLAERGLADRSLVSSMYPESLDLLGEVAPGLRRGWSVPRVRRDYTRSVLALPAYAVAQVWRARLPGQAAARIRAGRCEAVMAHRILVSGRLVSAVHAAGGQLYVWTVDDARRIRALEALGVDGVITNDPRLFG